MVILLDTYRKQKAITEFVFGRRKYYRRLVNGQENATLETGDGLVELMVFLKRKEKTTLVTGYAMAGLLLL